MLNESPLNPQLVTNPAVASAHPRHSANARLGSSFSLQESTQALNTTARLYFACYLQARDCGRCAYDHSGLIETCPQISVMRGLDSRIHALFGAKKDVDGPIKHCHDEKSGSC
jgi:hypothetical protein